MEFSIQQISGLIGFCISFIFTMMIAYDIIKKTLPLVRNKDGISDTTSLDIRILIYINVFIILLHMISCIMTSTLSSTNADCKLYNRISVALFDASRSLLYIIFVRRMIVIFNDTIFGLTRIRKYILYIFVALYSIPYLLYINWRAIEYKYNEEYGCLIEYKPHILHYTSSVLHIVIITYSLYLFIHPLHQLIELQDNRNISEKLYRVLIKYCILHCSSICSCIVLMIVSYLYPFGYNYSMIDAFINGAILILLHPIHNKLYKTLCCIFHSLCVKRCIKQDETLRSASALSYVIENKKSANPEEAQHPEETYEDIEVVIAPTETETEMVAPAIKIRDIMKRRVQTKFETQMQFETQTQFKITVDDITALRVKSASPLSMDSPLPNEVDEMDDNDEDKHKKTLSNTAVVSLNLSEFDSYGSKKRYLSPHNTVSQTRDVSIPKITPNDSTFSLQLSPRNTDNTDNNVDLERKASNTLRLINFESYQL